MSDYRQKCLREKGKACRGCGDTRHIEVHHIDGDRSNNDIQNLIPLCTACHRAIHDADVDLDRVLSEQWPEESFEDDTVRMTVAIPQKVKHVVEEIAEQRGVSQTKVGRDLVERGLSFEGHEESLNTSVVGTDGEKASDEYIEHLQEEIQFLRSLVEDAV